MTKIRGLIFDKDGTLLDFHATWAAWAASLIRRLAGGNPFTARRLADELGFDLDAVAFHPGSPLIAGTLELVVDAVLRQMPGSDRDRLRQVVLTETEAIQPVEVVPLAPLLDQLLADDMVLGVATNDAESAARAHMSQVGVLNSFAYLAGYDSGFGSKPGPGMLEGFCSATGLPPAACAMVGDSTHDLAAARAAGMLAVAVLSGPAPRAELAPLADVIIDDVAALPAWLASIGRDSRRVVGDDGLEPPTFSV